MVTLSNENKTAINNDNEKKEKPQIDTISQANLVLNENNFDNLNDLNIPHKKKIKQKNRRCFCNFLSNLFKKNNKMNKKYISQKIIKNEIKIKPINSIEKRKKERSIKNTKTKKSKMNCAGYDSFVSVRKERKIKKDGCKRNYNVKECCDYDCDNICSYKKDSCNLYIKDSISKSDKKCSNKSNDIMDDIMDDKCNKNCNINYNDLISDYSDNNKKCNKNENIDFKCESNNDVIDNYEKNIEKKHLNFNELILSQDIFEGNWTNNNEVKILIEEEKQIYEKIKKFSNEKNINEENGIITLLVLYYIYNKQSEKLNELKFIINKAKIYIKKIYNLEYEEILKELN